MRAASTRSSASYNVETIAWSLVRAAMVAASVCPGSSSRSSCGPWCAYRRPSLAQRRQTRSRWPRRAPVRSTVPSFAGGRFRPLPTVLRPISASRAISGAGGGLPRRCRAGTPPGGTASRRSGLSGCERTPIGSRHRAAATTSGVVGPAALVSRRAYLRCTLADPSDMPSERFLYARWRVLNATASPESGLDGRDGPRRQNRCPREEVGTLADAARRCNESWRERERKEPFERFREARGFDDRQENHAWLYGPANLQVARFLKTFEEFPPRAGRALTMPRARTPSRRTPATTSAHGRRPRSARARAARRRPSTSAPTSPACRA